MDKIGTCIRAVASQVGGPWLPNNCQNLDSDLFDIIYDTGTHFKCYKTSLHLQDLENQQDWTSECLYFKFCREACPHTSLQEACPHTSLRFSKKICPPNFSKLAMTLILFMTHASV